MEVRLPVNPPRSVTVRVDTREVKPYLFPSMITWYPFRSKKGYPLIIKVNPVRMETGDYCLEKWPSLAMIERKATVNEVATNLFSKDYKRALAALTRLSEEAKYPYLFVDSSASEFLTQNKWMGNIEPGMVLDNLERECDRLGIRLMFLGRSASIRSRTKAGEFVVRFLLAHAMREAEKKMKIQVD